MNQKNKQQRKSFLVISGMHRSNTSLLAQVMLSTGVDLGKSLMGASESNPYGHFEDYHFVRLHDEILKYNKSSWIPWFRKEYIIPEYLHLKGKYLFEKRFQPAVLSGFKDPRASLFLDYWRSIGNDRIKYIFIFRDYRSVVFSLLKRMVNSVMIRPYYAVHYMVSYCIYNECILAFYRKYRQQCYLIHNLDFIENPVGIIKNIKIKLDLAFDPDRFDHSLIDKSIKSGKNIAISKIYSNIVSFYNPRAKAVYEKMLQECDSKNDMK